MEQEIIYTKGYEQLRAELKEELSKSVESFVKIGYLLKVARDTNVLAESPYSNMEEFALAEFNIDKGTASKFMGINDRFAEGGYSDRLKSEYTGIGWSKLSIMLQLPDSINEEISPEFSKSEIQAIREEYAAEQSTTPLETAIEGETVVTQQAEDMLDKAILQLGESEPEIYTEIHKAIHEGYTYDLNEIKSIMAPPGEKIYSIRIRGVGRIMLSLKDFEETVSIINERTGDKQTRLWDDVARAWLQIIDVDQTPEENWETIYGTTFPKKEEPAPVAPVQTKKEVKKVQKVNEKPQKPMPAPVEESKEETQIPGQDNILNHPEYLPEQMKGAVGESAPEDSQPAAVVQPVAPVQPESGSDGEGSDMADRWKLTDQELFDLWAETGEKAESVYGTFFSKHDGRTYSGKDLVEGNIPMEDLKNLWEEALAVAANLERIINGKKHTAQ